MGVQGRRSYNRSSHSRGGFPSGTKFRWKFANTVGTRTRSLGPGRARGPGRPAGGEDAAAEVPEDRSGEVDEVRLDAHAWHFMHLQLVGQPGNLA